MDNKERRATKRAFDTTIDSYRIFCEKFKRQQRTRIRFVADGRFGHSSHPLLHALWLAHALRYSTRRRASIGVRSRRRRCRYPIRARRFPCSKCSRRIEHSFLRSYIRIDNVADFEITEGREIRVWPATGAAQKDIEIFLLGPAWATLCHQRRILPLHASAIATETGIIALAGHPGAGKSTIAAMLSTLNHELIADDILPVGFNEDLIPGAWPYLRRLKLHRDLITRLAFTPAEKVSENLDKDKYFVHPKFRGADKWRRLERIYLLEKDVTGSHYLIEPLTGADAVRALVDQTYHFDFILGTRQFGEHLAFCARLASKVAIYRLRWTPLSALTGEFGSLIHQHLKGADDNPDQVS